MTRTKVWNDRRYAEMWNWNGQHVLRFRMRIADIWNYRIGEFTADHCPYAAGNRDRRMTQEEITQFKLAPAMNCGLRKDWLEEFTGRHYQGGMQ